MTCRYINTLFDLDNDVMSLVLDIVYRKRYDKTLAFYSLLVNHHQSILRRLPIKYDKYEWTRVKTNMVFLLGRVPNNPNLNYWLKHHRKGHRYSYYHNDTIIHHSLDRSDLIKGCRANAIRFSVKHNRKKLCALLMANNVSNL